MNIRKEERKKILSIYTAVHIGEQKFETRKLKTTGEKEREKKTQRKRKKQTHSFQKG